MLPGALLLVALSTVVPSAYSLRAPLVRRTDGFLDRRDSGSHDSSAPSNTSDHHHTAYLHNEHDLLYGVNVTIGGQDIILNVDSRSSDLWVYHPNIQIVNTTSVAANLSYAGGSVSGPIDYTTVEFAGQKVPSQAFIHVNKTSGLECLTKSVVSGVLGFGLTGGSALISSIFQTFYIPTTLGFSLSGNIYQQNKLTNHPNFFTLLLGRTEVDIKQRPGVFTISEYAEGYEAIANAPKLTNVLPDRWSVAIDSMLMGNYSHPFGTIVPGLTPGKGAAVVDTGFSMPPIPQHCVDWIYGILPGAVSVYDVPELQSIGADYIFPCNEMTDVTLMIGGRDYPLHPLDLSKIVTVPLNGEKITFCYNIYQNYNPQGVDYDIVLGDPFLKSTYVSYNHGPTDGSGSGLPYVQLLSTIKLDDARKEFATIRAKQLNGLKEISPAEVKKLIKKDPSSLAGLNVHSVAYTGEHPHPASSSSHSHSGSSSDSGSPSDVASNVSGVRAADGSGVGDTSAVTNLLNKYSPIVVGLLAGNLLVLLVLAALSAYFCISRSGKCATTKMMSMNYHPVKMAESKDGMQMEPFAARYDA